MLTDFRENKQITENIQVAQKEIVSDEGTKLKPMDLTWPNVKAINMVPLLNSIIFLQNTVKFL